MYNKTSRKLNMDELEQVAGGVDFEVVRINDTSDMDLGELPQPIIKNPSEYELDIRNQMVQLQAMNN